MCFSMLGDLSRICYNDSVSQRSVIRTSGSAVTSREPAVASIADFDDPKVGPNLRPILVSNELLARNALFERKDAEASAEQKWLFLLLAWISRLVLVIAILSGTVLAATVI